MNSSATAEQHKQLVQIIHRATTEFQGPLPPPEMLEHYNRIIPGSAERLMVLAEKQVEHRIRQETEIVRRRLDIISRGQVIGTLLALSFGGLGCYLTLQGHDGVAALVFGTTILGLVAAFVLGRSPKTGGT